MKDKFELVMGAVALTVIVVFIGAWIYNLNQLLDCDFESDYKCEVVHIAGVLIPPVSLVTVWFAVDPAKTVD